MEGALLQFLREVDEDVSTEREVDAWEWRSLSEVVNGTTRILLWHQPGVYDHADPSYPGVPYELTTTNLSEAEFQQIADSLG